MWISLFTIVIAIVNATIGPVLRFLTFPLTFLTLGLFLLVLNAFLLKLALGEMSEILLASQRVLPRAAQSAGFEFRYPEIGAALHAAV